MSEAKVLPVKGKLIAIVPEEYYISKGQACPFPECKSKLIQAYITDNRDAEGDFIADTMQCPECQSTYVVLSMPKLHIAAPIILNWTLTEKGVSKYGTKGMETQTEQGGETGSGTSSDSGEFHEATPVSGNAESEEIVVGTS